MKNRAGKLAAIGLILLLGPTAAGATPIAYQMMFEVETITFDFNVADLAVGNTYYGSFVVDDAILGTDGLNQGGDISAFMIKMHDTVWSYNLPFPTTEYAGFRGPDGLNSPSPGFDILGGEIVNLRGGVFGISDNPYVNFTLENRVNSFNASIAGLGSFKGSMKVARVPVSGTLSLLAIGLASLCFVGFRRTKPRKGICKY